MVVQFDRAHSLGYPDVDHAKRSRCYADFPGDELIDCGRVERAAEIAPNVLIGTQFADERLVRLG